MNLDVLALMLLAVLQTVPTSEYRERRERLWARHADGIVVLHARSTAAGLRANGFKQDASFFYLHRARIATVRYPRARRPQARSHPVCA